MPKTTNIPRLRKVPAIRVPRLHRVPVLAVLAGALCGIVLWIAVNAIVDTAVRSDTAAQLALTNCHQIEKVDARIRLVVQAGLDSLGKPGSAGYAYYHSHPAELANARIQSRQSLFTFRARHCP